MAFALNSIVSLLISSLLTIVPAQPEPSPEPVTWTQGLNNEVEKIEQNFDGNLGVLIEDLNTKERF